MTTTTLAAELSKSDTAIRMWEIGKSKPDADTLIRLASYFNCSVDYILGLSDFKNKDSWRELKITESDIQKHLSKFAGRKTFLKSLDYFLECIGEIDDTKTRNNAISHMRDILHNCGEQASKSREIRQSSEARHDVYIEFLGLHEDCIFSLLSYRNELRRSACAINRELTPFGIWLNGINGLDNGE